MTRQRAMKFLAIAAVVLALWALRDWRQTGEAPSPWLVRGAMAAMVAAFLIFIVDPQTRPRMMLQFLAALFASVALFAFAADYSAAKTAGTPLVLTPLLDRLFDFAPTLVAMIRNFATGTLGAWAWDPVLTSILGRSTEAVFLVLAMLCGYAGRRRRVVRIFSN